MGCASSKSAETASAGDKTEKKTSPRRSGQGSDRSGKQGLNNMLDKSNKRMSVGTTTAAQEIFQKNLPDYHKRRRQSIQAAASVQANPPSPAADATSPRSRAAQQTSSKSVVMTYAEVREVMKDIDDALMEFLLRVFDPEGTGTVSSEQFVLALGLISTVANSVDEQIEACFYMFDTDRQGTLDKQEFRAMLEATVALKLRYLLQTEEGTAEFEQQLATEYSHENLEFWKLAREYTNLPDGQRAAEAKRLMDEFVVNGAPQQVNLPATMQAPLVDQWRAIEKEGTEPPANIFEGASKEIFKLMENDTFRRFQHDTGQVDKLVNDFFDKADVNKTGEITFEQYREWVMANPSVLVFFNELSSSIQGMLAKQRAAHTAMESRRALRGTIRSHSFTHVHPSP